ncbi:MAG: hypothetical protein D6768_17070 [Chloroflexi bacterium]|nr:MAG: hypothetical protein D6768_17070 [Chloroflexota bacterium]
MGHNVCNERRGLFAHCIIFANSVLFSAGCVLHIACNFGPATHNTHHKTRLRLDPNNTNIYPGSGSAANNNK